MQPHTHTHGHTHAHTCNDDISKHAEGRRHTTGGGRGEDRDVQQLGHVLVHVQRGTDLGHLHTHTKCVAMRCALCDTERESLLGMLARLPDQRSVCDVLL